MGVDLKDLIPRMPISLEDLSGKVIAIAMTLPERSSRDIGIRGIRSFKSTPMAYAHVSLNLKDLTLLLMDETSIRPLSSNLMIAL